MRSSSSGAWLRTNSGVNGRCSAAKRCFQRAARALYSNNGYELRQSVIRGFVVFTPNWLYYSKLSSGGLQYSSTIFVVPNNDTSDQSTLIGNTAQMQGFACKLHGGFV
jgi:hypothetical protein